MIHSQETDFSGADIWKCKTDNRKSPQNFRGDSPKLKKARYSWQVKNKNSTVADDRVHSQVTVTINGAQQHKGLQKIESCLDSIKPCCSRSVPNDLITNIAIDNCSNIDRCDNAKGKLCDSLPFNSAESEHAATEAGRAIHCGVDDENPTGSDENTANGALNGDQQNDNNQDSCNLGFSYNNLDDSSKSDSSVIILVPQLSDVQPGSDTDSTDYPTAQNLVTRSIDPNEPLRYIAMPTGKWLLECSLMRAELDNDINKALERLRYYADQSAQWAQQAYISNRISLETAGIFQVIEEQGLRTSSSSSSHPNDSALRSYCRDQTLAVHHLASSSAWQNDDKTKSLHKNVFKNTEENVVYETMSDLSSTRDEPASPNASLSCSLQSNCLELCRTGDMNAVNEPSSAPSSSFIIDQAVSAVIVERGIHM